MATARINHQTLSFKDSGGSGPALLFLHGFLMDQSMFDAQVAILAPKYRCIAMDTRAFGQTEWDQLPFSLYDSVADGVGVLDFLNLKSALWVGMSQGGYCALRAALTVSTRVDGLILIGAQAGVNSAEVNQGYLQTRDIWKEQGPIDPLLEGLATAILGPKTTPKMVAIWDHWLPKWKQIPATNIFHAMNSLLNRDDITEAVKKIQCPALVIHGTADYAVPLQLGESLAEGLPKCLKFVPVDGAAHAPNLTHAKLIEADLLDFLAKVVG
jgi:pimeloyl-ACP methyl ester carboxylesterase